MKSLTHLYLCFLISTLAFASASSLGAADSKITVPVILPGSTETASVKMPWDLYSDYLEIDGTGDFAKTAALLAPLHFQPIPVAPNLAFWSIFGAHHLKSDLENGNQGGYREAFFTVLAQPIVNSGSAPAPGLLIVKIWVTDEAAKVAGNEYWGTNKDLARIYLSLDPAENTVGFSLRELSGEPIVFVSMPTPNAPSTANQNVMVYSRFKQIPTSFFGTGVATTANLTGQQTIEFSKRGWAGQLTGVNFRPTQAKLVTKTNIRFGTPLDLTGSQSQ